MLGCELRMSKNNGEFEMSKNNGEFGMSKNNGEFGMSKNNGKNLKIFGEEPGRVTQNYTIKLAIRQTRK